MWKRLQGHVREKDRHAQIGNPVLLETTYDEDRLRRNPHVTDAQNGNYTYNAPAPHPYTLSPLDPHNYRASEVPVSESSVYSRPSHDLEYHENPTAPSRFAYEDISPPSSPEPEQSLSAGFEQPRTYKSMRDVSPMDENRGRIPTASHASNIPVLRKAPPRLQTGEAEPPPKFWGGKVAPNSKVKWDEYSGEPTSSNAGRAGSVSPGTYAKLASTTDTRPMGYHVTVSGPQKRNVSFTERVGRLGARSPPVEAAKPEPWSRATGRSEIAPPLQYKPAAKPLQVPRKTLSPTAEKPAQATRNAPATSTSRVPGEADTAPVADSPSTFDTHNAHIKPTVPLKVGGTTPPRNLTSPTSPAHPKGLGIQTQYPYSPITPTTQRRDAESPDTVLHEESITREIPVQQKRPSTPPQDLDARKSSETPEKDRQAPTSRFSWTTYNSGTTYQHSPPPSPPQDFSTSTPPRNRAVTEPISAATAASSILTRRRPIPHSDRPDPVPSRKPISTDSPGTAKVNTMSSPTSNGPPSPSTASVFSTSTSKALPAPPSALTAADHIAVLESQMEDLRIRRSNVYRLLTDLNKAAPPNPLLTDFRRARLAEQRKKDFEGELSEIKREEHEVGLKLHRAWKKREREDPNSAGSALWVRRVTS